MSVRRSRWRARLGSFPRTLTAFVVALALVLPLLLSTGCASDGAGGERLHVVRRGENLYRIGQRYGVTAREIASVNGIRDVTAVAIGTRLRIPRSSGRLRKPASDPGLAEVRRTARSEARSSGGLQFRWPVSGSVTSRYGKRRRNEHQGIDIAARRGTPIYAAEAGKVVHAGRIDDYGHTVIIKHAGQYRTVYAHANRLYVAEGAFVERGDRIAEVGSSGNATGPHLHFEIRDGGSASDPMAYLP